MRTIASLRSGPSCLPTRGWSAAIGLALASMLPGTTHAQLGPVPAIPLATLNQPNGPATLGSDGTLTVQRVRPPLATTAASLGQAVWDHPSIRLFGADCGGVADDSKAVSAAATALAGTGTDILVPGDCKLNIGPGARLAGTPIVFDGVNLSGPGGRDSGAPYGARGGTILLTDTGGPAFIVKRNWRFSGLVFYWPGQTEAAAIANGGVPVAYPALMTGQGGAGLPPAEVSSGFFQNNDVINAYDVMDFSADVSGGLQVDRNRAFFLDNFMRLNQMPLESWVDHNDFSPNAFQSAPGMLGPYPTHTMLNYAATHASDIEAVGNGSASTLASHTIDGLNFSANYTFGLGYGLRALGGAFNLATWADNSFDGVAHPVSVETGGAIVGGSSLSGGRIYGYTFGEPTNPAAYTAVVTVAADSAPNSSLSVENVSVPSSSGGLVDWEGAAGTLDFVNVKADGANNGGSATAISAVKMNSLGGRLRITSSRITEGGTTPGDCIEVDQPLQFMTIAGNQFTSCLAPISLGGAFATPSKVTGNFSSATTGHVAIGGAQAGTIDDLENTWDVPGATWTHGLRGADGALQFSFRGSPEISLTPAGNATVPGRFVSTALGPFLRAVPMAAQLFSGSKTQVVFANATVDSTGLYANSTFHAPYAGLYEVSAAVEQDGAAVTTGDIWTLFVDQAGSVTSSTEQDAAVTSGQISALTMRDVVQLAAGDTVQCSIARLSGTGTLRTIADGGRSRLIVHQLQ